VKGEELSERIEPIHHHNQGHRPPRHEVQTGAPGLRSDYKDCNCRKSIYIYENGEDHPIAAKTRSWSEAQKIAQEE